jgi:fructose-1,6-bisphosphatase/inositol monophosphatase family enzyme
MEYACSDVRRITEALLKAAEIGARVCCQQRAKSSIYFKPIQNRASAVVALATSILTSADQEVQEVILQYLLDCGLSNCTIQAEEETPSLHKFNARSGTPTIFIDPIDGTLAYSMGCPNWEKSAMEAGFPKRLLTQTKAKLDPRFYGIVLGARVPESPLVAVCVLPELQITYYAMGGNAFRNGVPFRYSGSGRPRCIAIGRRLLDASGEAATPFAAAGIDVRWFTGSCPAILWHIFEGVCTGYAGLACAFDVQLTVTEIEDHFIAKVLRLFS